MKKKATSKGTLKNKIMNISGFVWRKYEQVCLAFPFLPSNFNQLEDIGKKIQNWIEYNWLDIAIQL